MTRNNQHSGRRQQPSWLQVNMCLEFIWGQGLQKSIAILWYWDKWKKVSKHIYMLYPQILSLYPYKNSQELKGWWFSFSSLWRWEIGLRSNSPWRSHNQCKPEPAPPHPVFVQPLTPGCLLVFWCPSCVLSPHRWITVWTAWKYILALFSRNHNQKKMLKTPAGTEYIHTFYL